MESGEVASTPSALELRWFGVLVFVLFGAIGGLVLWRFASLAAAVTAWGLGTALAVPYYAVPRLRLPFYRLWMFLTHPIGRFVSNGALAIVYFLILTPIALAFRLFRRDALALRFDRAAPSYWEAHDPGRDPDRYFRQS